MTPKKDLPQLTIDDVIGSEGSTLLFTVSVNKATTDTLTVTYRTEDVEATGIDYFSVSTPMSVKIYPGEMSFSISVRSKTDAVTEGDETFKLILADAENGEILDGEGIGTIQNTVAQTPNFMKAKIGSQQWSAIIGSFFGAAFIGNTFAGYGTDNDSQLSFVFFTEPTAAKTYGIEVLGASDDSKVSVYYSPTFFSSGGLGKTYNGQPEGGELVITKYDVAGKIAEGTFKFTGKDEDGNLVQVTEGSFRVPIE